ncbi:MAG: phospho-N-acetylmuramoyl-pentapeptide-transferase [Ardenticatenales bacterium]|nr:phospho-N-acetylmuramoyl-pentapeptide-transferase [Ardenticatenales bacterium]
MNHWLSALLYVALFATPAFVLVALATGPLTRWLAQRQLGKAIREDGPQHASKAGTPTMGGLVLVATVLLSTIAIGALAYAFLFRPMIHVADDTYRVAESARVAATALVRMLTATAVAIVLFGAIGLADDWQGLARKGRARAMGIGLSARRLIALQLAAAVIVALLLAWVPTPKPFASDTQLGATSAHPGAQAFLQAIAVDAATFENGFGAVAWLVVASLVLVATVNGVNLSDGLDGLAAGLAAVAFAALGLVLLRWHNWVPEGDRMMPIVDATLFVLCFAIAGACLGFLVHNRFPARVFMGNVTSMALGGALATIALATGTWLLLPLIGIVYVAEVLSDIIQVGYFKWTGGKRFFRMAPLHHHFELLGMHESAVTRRFWLAGAAGAALAVGFVYWATWGMSG